MAALAATGISNPGQALSAGDRDALFMKVFTGEVLTAFSRTSVMMSRHQVRTISHGKSASFAIMGRTRAKYLAPGNSLDDQRKKMEHNELDVIYILDTPRWNKNWVKVMEKAEPVIFVSAPNYKLAGKKNIEVEEILNAPFYLTERNANYRQALEQELALHKQTLSPVLECSDTAFIKKMLKTGKGLSYLPLFVVEKDIDEGKIAKLDVKDIDITMYRQVFYHANKYMTKEMEKFVEYCRL